MSEHRRESDAPSFLKTLRQMTVRAYRAASSTIQEKTSTLEERTGRR